MTPQELKNSILQLAIQGKLVEQRPEEGTAKELYQQIQAEKQRLINEGTIKKEKPLPEIAEDKKPYDIPESWKWIRWGDLSESIQYGYNAAAQESGRIKMVRISDIQDGNVLWPTVPFCDIKEDDIEMYLLKKNDILFARTGGTVGKSYLVKDIPEESIYAGYLIRTRYSAMLCPEYMKYFMDSQLYWTQLRNGTIATAQPNCNGKTLSKMIIPLPPLAEQKRIVAKIEELLLYINRYEKAWSKLEDFNKRFPTDMQKSILQMAIQGKLVEQRTEEGTGEELYQHIQVEKQRLIKAGTIKKEKPLPEITEDEKPFDIPESWKWEKVGNIFEVIRGSSPRPKGSPLYWANEETEFYWVTIKDISDNTINGKLYQTHEYLTRAGAALSTYVGKEELIIAVSGSTTGKHCILGINGYIYDGLAAVINRTRIISSQYIMFFFDWVYEKLNSQKIGSAFPNINTDILKNTLIPLPPLAEQKRIVSKLEEILPLCEKLK